PEPEPEPEKADLAAAEVQAANDPAPPAPPDPDTGGNAFSDLDTPPKTRFRRAAALAHTLRGAPPAPTRLAEAAPAIARLQALLALMRSRE
uniref:hypothetical protein n=1 Tax=Natronohydrobacter thiooxidans TaxID=87172 RepID=UPI000B156B38